MSRVTDRIRRAARKVGAKAEAAVEKAEKRAQRAVQKRQGGRLRKVAEVVAVAGAAAVTGAVVDEAARRLRRPVTKGQVGRVGRPLAFEVPLPISSEAAIARVTDALRAEGFGVLTRIDAHNTFREKLGVDFRSYTILGACNPSLALRALTATPDAGMLLPCNVTVEATKDGGSVVRIVNPITMLEDTALAENAALRAVAADAERGLARAAEWMKEHGHAAVL